jgi:hypothetical protein
MEDAINEQTAGLKNTYFRDGLNWPLQIWHLMASLSLLMDDDQTGNLLGHWVQNRLDGLSVEYRHSQASTIKDKNKNTATQGIPVPQHKIES